jgi:N6-adenosine-specific RNA methylase IME4/ParB-like chromosome segregation protein Spo0J
MNNKPVQRKAHPYADILPLLEGEAFDALVADIKANRLLNPIWIHDEKVLDGRNRLRACEAAGVEPTFVEFTGNDPLGFVLSQNIKRRQLDASQLAMVAARIANMRQGERTDLQPSANLQKVSRGEAARLLNVSERSVASAAFVRDHATPELVRAVDQGKITVSIAADLAGESNAVQGEAVADPSRAHTIAKQRNRALREHLLSGKQLSWGKQETFGVVYADPPWRFEPYSRETGMDRAADNHYPTLTTDKIKALDVSSITAKDCVLFLWATAPMLPQALSVMAAWGFDYKSETIWVKDRDGSGYWFINRHEHLLVGTKGKIPAPAPGTQWKSVIEAPASKHSAKPKIFHELIEGYFPNLPKIELFARGKARPGWSIRGNEAALDRGAL